MASTSSGRKSPNRRDEPAKSTQARIAFVPRSPPSRQPAPGRIGPELRSQAPAPAQRRLLLSVGSEGVALATSSRSTEARRSNRSSPGLLSHASSWNPRSAETGSADVDPDSAAIGRRSVCPPVVVIVVVTRESGASSESTVGTPESSARRRIDPTNRRISQPGARQQPTSISNRPAPRRQWRSTHWLRSAIDARG